MRRARDTLESFKDKRIVYKPEEKWITVKDTHEAPVDQATFDTVQQRIQVKQPRPRNMLRGLMFCGGCSTRMAFSAASGRKACGHYSCEMHRRYGTGECSAHDISVKQISTNIAELTEERLHTFTEKMAVHEKEVIDGETVMWIDIYYRFIGKVGCEKVEALKAAKSRRAQHPADPRRVNRMCGAQ